MKFFIAIISINEVKQRYKLLLIVFLMTMNSLVFATELIMMRSVQEFPETMASLQKAIKISGNTVSRIQNIDIGLSKMGYRTDKYRVVFYGKITEINSLVNKHPELIPYLPLKIAVFSENGQTVLTATNPSQLIKMYPDKNLKALFSSWTKDLRGIMANVQQDSDANAPFTESH